MVEVEAGQIFCNFCYGKEFLIFQVDEELTIKCATCRTILLYEGSKEEEVRVVET